MNPPRVRRFLPLPGAPSVTPPPRNPLSSSAEKGIQPQESVPLQLPPPVEWFATCYGVGGSLAGLCSERAEPASPSPTRSSTSSFPLACKSKGDGDVAVLLSDYNQQGLLAVCFHRDSSLDLSFSLRVPGGVAQLSCGVGSTHCITSDRLLYVVDQSEDNRNVEDGTGLSKVRLGGGTPVALVSAGGRTVVALSEDGFVYCWGDNQNGQCIRHKELPNVSVPVRFGTGKYNARTVSCGGGYVALVFQDGAVGTWGESDMLGAIVPMDQLEPALGDDAKKLCMRRVLNLRLEDSIVSVSAAATHAVLISSAGHLFSWGSGRYGKLGHGTTSDERKPRQLTASEINSEFFSGVSCGPTHTVAMTASGAVWVWGSNHAGQLGLPFKEPPAHSTPQQMALALDGVSVMSVSCGRSHTYLLLSDGDLLLCGSPVLHGHGVRFSFPRRIRCGFLTLAVASSPTHSALGCMPRTTTITAVGKGQQLEVEGPVVDFAAGVGFFVFVTSDGRSLRSCGTGVCGQLGCGEEARSSESFTSLHDVRLPLLGSQLIQCVSCGPDFVVCVLSDGQMLGWGSNKSGQIAAVEEGPAFFTARPVTLYHSLGAVAQVACGGSFLVVLLESGAVYTNGDGVCSGFPCPPGTVTAPALVQGLSKQRVINIAAGTAHTVALAEDGQVFTWGRGVLGDGSAVAYSPIALSTFGSSPIRSVGCGPKNSFAICQSGELWVWGDNSHCQCGVPSTDGRSVTYPVRAAQRVKSAAFSSRCSLVVHEGGCASMAGAADYVLGQRVRKASSVSFTEVILDSPKRACGMMAGEARRSGVCCYRGYDAVPVMVEHDRPSCDSVRQAFAQLRKLPTT